MNIEHAAWLEAIRKFNERHDRGHLLRGYDLEELLELAHEAQSKNDCLDQE